MRNLTPKQSSILISVFITIVGSGLMLLTFTIDKQDLWKIFLIYVLVLFLFSYIVVYLAFSRLIIEKIKPIYKTIHNKGYADGLMDENVEDKDIISNVRDDVIDWAVKKSDEIKRLKATEKYRKEFLGNVSHELKTPIFNIQGYVLTLLDGGLYDETINLKYLQKAEKSINRLISIVQDLETISRIEQGALKLQVETFELNQLVEEVFENFDERAKKNNMKLIGDFKPKTQIDVKADKHQIYQVFSNLISNAIKYGKQDGSIKVRFFDMDNHILVEVEDDGIGIPEESISRLFERFYRVDKSRSRDQGGTGLGLSIVKHILDAHGQSVNVKSKYGEGTSFTFTLEKANQQ